MPDTAAILNEAYGLIEQGELSRARSLLQPLLESDSLNPDVWWLYTHAAADADEGRRALDRVLDLDPEYPGAAALSEQLGSTPRVVKPLSSLKPATPPAPLPTTSTASEPDLDDEDEFTDTSAPDQRQRSSRMLLIVGAVVLVIALLLFFLLPLLNPTPPATPTAVVGLGTTVETLTSSDPLTPADVSGTVTSDNGLAVSSPTGAAEITVESFSQTATALVVTNVSAQVATEESSASLTDEPTSVMTAEAMVETTEAVLATENALLPAVTDDAAATQDLVVTQDISVTQETVVTQELIVTEESVMTQAMTAEAVLTDESSLIVPTTVVTVEVAPTEEAGLLLTAEVTAAPTQDPLDTLAVKLEVLNVTRDNITIDETMLGPTLIVQVCAPPVASATSALNVTMNALAETIADVPDVDAVGVNLACDDAPPRIIAVSASEAAAFGRGEIDSRTFRQGWQPVDLVTEASNG